MIVITPAEPPNPMRSSCSNKLTRMALRRKMRHLMSINKQKRTKRNYHQHLCAKWDKIFFSDFNTNTGIMVYEYKYKYIRSVSGPRLLPGAGI